MSLKRKAEMGANVVATKKKSAAAKILQPPLYPHALVVSKHSMHKDDPRKIENPYDDEMIQGGDFHVQEYVFLHTSDCRPASVDVRALQRKGALYALFAPILQNQEQMDPNVPQEWARRKPPMHIPPKFHLNAQKPGVTFRRDWSFFFRVENASCYVGRFLLNNDRQMLHHDPEMFNSFELRRYLIDIGGMRNDLWAILDLLLSTLPHPILDYVVDYAMPFYSYVPMSKKVAEDNSLPFAPFGFLLP